MVGIRNLAVIVCAATLAACGFSAEFHGRLSCDDMHPCPSGFACSGAGFCESSSPGIDGGPLNGSGDGGQSASACGTTDALRASFDDSGDIWPWEYKVGGAGAVAIVDGTAVLSVPGGDESYVILESRGYYDLDSSTINIVFQQEPGPAQTRLDARVLGEEMAFFMEVDGGRFRVGRQTSEGASILYETDFVASEHRAWQMREQDGWLVFESAGQAGDWMQRAMWNGAPTAPVGVSLELDGDSSIVEPSSAVIESINVDRSGVHCPIDTVFDTFDDGEPGANWSPWDYNGCVWVETSGTLRFQNFTDVYSDCGYRSRRLYSLVDSELPALIFESGTGAGNVNFGVRINEDERYSFRVAADANTLYIVHYDSASGEATVSVEFVYETSKYWRFRYTDEIIFEVSGDGTNWTSVHTVADDRVDAVQIMLWGSGDATGPGESGFQQVGD